MVTFDKHYHIRCTYHVVLLRTQLAQAFEPGTFRPAAGDHESPKCVCELVAGWPLDIPMECAHSLLVNLENV